MSATAETDPVAAGGEACASQSSGLSEVVYHVAGACWLGVSARLGPGAVPYQQWVDQDLRTLGLPDHLFEHLATMARLHAQGRYDRVTRDVEKITGRPATSVREFVKANPALFESPSNPVAASPPGQPAQA